MDRRAFAHGLLALPFGLFLVRCSSNQNALDTAAGPRVNGGQIVYTSSTTNLHVHLFAIDIASIDSPPNDGVSGDTTLNEAHTHFVEVSTDQLSKVSAGDSVQVKTSETNGHTHWFTFTNMG
jgi:hypothetical protein